MYAASHSPCVGPTEDILLHAFAPLATDDTYCAV